MIGFNDWEPLLVYGKNDGVQMHDYLAMANNEKMGEFNHPCPKPLGWAKWIIQRTTRDDHVILDPFFGSGTTGVAAKLLGRQFIGIEISEKYCEIARKRIDQTLVNKKLEFK